MSVENDPTRSSQIAPEQKTTIPILKTPDLPSQVSEKPHPTLNVPLPPSTVEASLAHPQIPTLDVPLPTPTIETPLINQKIPTIDVPLPPQQAGEIKKQPILQTPTLEVKSVEVKNPELKAPPLKP